MSSPNLIFQNVIYGKGLQLLYSLKLGIEWYSVCMALGQIIAMSIVAIYLSRKISDKILKYIVIALFYVMWLCLIAKLQFTSTTALIAFSGVLLLLEKKWVQGGLLLLVASLMRFESAMMIGLFMSPIFIYVYKLEWKKSWLPLAVVLLLIIGCEVIDQRNYSQSSELQSFCKHNALRSKIQDNPNAWRAYGHLPKNISKNDYDLFLSFVYDSSVFSTDIMNQIFQIINKTPLYKKIKNTIPYLIKPHLFSLMVIFVSLILFLVMMRQNINRILLVSTILLWFVSLIVIGLNMYVKPYVYFASLYAIIFVFLFVSLAESSSRTSFRLITYLISIICAVSLFIDIISYVNNYDTDIYREQQELIDNTKEKVLGLYYNQCSISPFALIKQESDRFAGFAFLTELSERSNSFMRLSADCIILIKKGSPMPNMIARSLEEHNNLFVDVRLIEESEHCSLVKLQVVEE